MVTKMFNILTFSFVAFFFFSPGIYWNKRGKKYNTEMPSLVRQNSSCNVELRVWKYRCISHRKESDVSGEKAWNKWTCYSCVYVNYNIINTILRTKNKVWLVTDRNCDCQMS